MQTYPISWISEDSFVNFETLPAFKITYPCNQSDHAIPYTQFFSCLTPQHLVIRTLAFESLRPTFSQTKATFFCSQQQDSFLYLTAHSSLEKGVSAVWQTPSLSIPLSCTTHPLDGDDLQGTYWGWDIWIPVAELQQKTGESMTLGSHWMGNFYKCEGSEEIPTASFFPTQTDPFSRNSTVNFSVVPY